MLINLLLHYTFNIRYIYTYSHRFCINKNLYIIGKKSLVANRF